MIRTALDADRGEILDIVVAAGMFARDEVGVVDELLREHLAGPDHDDHRCLVSDRDGRLVGVAFAELRPAADRVWDLVMIGVRPESQGTGDGTALTAAIERQARSAGGRLLVVETSATPQYAGARAFYTARGFDEEARVRDYWSDGDDLIVFRKRLAPAT